MLFLQFVQPNLEIPPDSVILNRWAENTQNFIQLSWEDKLHAIVNGAMDVGLKLIAAIAVFIIGRWLIKRFDKLIHHIFIRRGVDTSVDTFVRNMVRVVGYVILIMILVSILGIRTTSFVALLASAGFAIGMALSGTLQNFAGGMMILLLKPFRTGDYIIAQGYEGTVKQIRLFSTILITSDNKTIIMPNGGLSTNIVNNVSEAGTRRVEWVFYISNGDNYDVAKEIIRNLLLLDKRVLETPPFLIALQSLDKNDVGIVVRAWTESGDYWDVFFSMNEKVYKLFPEHGLRIPSSVVSVNITKEGEAQKECKKQVIPTAAAIKKSVKGVGETDTKADDNSILRADLDLDTNEVAQQEEEK